MTGPVTMTDLQEGAHSHGHDYVAGSPHLQHGHLNARIRDLVRETLNATAERIGRRPRVLEVGAGHGAFTDTVAGAGAEVVVTEMSLPSARLLKERFRCNDAVEVMHDPEGTVEAVGAVDVVLYTSVLHHIPDYLPHIERAMSTIRPGGALLSFQDPLFYPRQPRAQHFANWAAYYAWRAGRGDLGRGFATVARRIRGVYDEANVSDMSEYHVVRQGVDEVAIQAMLDAQFAQIEVLPYWSSQSAVAQRLGERARFVNTFGVIASDRA